MGGGGGGPVHRTISHQMQMSVLKKLSQEVSVLSVFSLWALSSISVGQALMTSERGSGWSLPLFDLLPATSGFNGGRSLLGDPDLLLHSPRHHISASFRYEDIFRERVGGNNRRVVNSFYSLEAGLPLGEGEFTLEGEVQGFGLDLLLEENRHVKLECETRSLETCYAHPLSALNLDLGASLGVSEYAGEGRLSGGLSAWYQPLPEVSLGGYVSSLHQRWDVLLQIEDETIDLPIGYRLPGFGLQLKLRDLWRLSLLGEVRFSSLKGISAASDKFRLEPRGELSTCCLSSRAELSPTVGFSFGWSTSSVDTEGELYDLDQKFGNVSAGDLSWERLECRLDFQPWSRHRLVAFLVRENLSVTLRGRLESWPFTPTLIDLLGQRFYFRGDGRVIVDLTGLAYSFDRSPNLEVEADFRWLALYPRAQISTWNPQVFGFGITNLKRYCLKYERVNAINLSFGVTKSWHDLQIGYRFSQLLPVYAKKTEAEGAIGEPSPTLPVKTRSTYGGGFHLLTLSYPL
jgi:hypothetical protein